jgi:hypothetical protein
VVYFLNSSSGQNSLFGMGSSQGDNAGAYQPSQHSSRNL